MNANLALTNLKNRNIYRYLNNKFGEKMFFNDFESVIEAEFTEIADAKKVLLNKGAKIAMMSGSGSAVFGIFTDSGIAQSAFEAIESEKKWLVFNTKLKI